MLVDDEAATRQGLTRHIRWAELGVDELFDASSAAVALELAAEVKPDIVMTDIIMPGMSGIELSAALRELLPQCKIIFISGYPDKEHLKAAIQISAVGFVEKPIKLEEAAQVIRKAVALCREDARRALYDREREELIGENIPAIRQHLVQTLLSSRDGYAEARKYWNVLILGFPASGMLNTVLVRIDGGPWQAEDGARISGAALGALSGRLGALRALCGAFGHQQLAVVLPAQAAGDPALTGALEAFLRDMRSAAPDVRLYCGVGVPELGLEGAYGSHLAAKRALRRAVFYGRDIAADSEEEDSLRSAAQAQGMFAQLLGADKDAEALALLRKLCGEMAARGRVNTDSVREEFARWVSALRARAKQLEIPESDADFSAQAQLRQAQTLSELWECVEGWMRRLAENRDGLKAGNGKVQQVMRLVEERFGDPRLTTKSLADSVYLTPTYLSTLFHRSTGRTINEYIAQTRMKKAKEMLADYRLKLYEIAGRLGYVDANYFAKVFKRSTGLTPSEYREKYVK